MNSIIKKDKIFGLSDFITCLVFGVLNLLFRDPVVVLNEKSAGAVKYSFFGILVLSSRYETIGSIDKPKHVEQRRVWVGVWTYRSMAEFTKYSCC